MLDRTLFFSLLIICSDLPWHGRSVAISTTSPIKTRLSKRSPVVTDDNVWEKIHVPAEDLEADRRHLSEREGKNGEYVNLAKEATADIEFVTSHTILHNQTNHEHNPIHVASWKWDYVRTPFIYTAVVIVAGFCKIGFHHAEFLSSLIPESCMLILLGVIVGTIVHFTHSRELLPQFTPKAFFLFLLPPIVLESAYSLHDRAFFSNLGTIVLYAVVGTVINCFAIGGALYGLIYLGAVGSIQLHFVESLVFSSVISAVDPVAVLAIFQEVGVNKDLYFLVFGESLLNDAVTIVLYTMMVGFSQVEYITAEQVGIGFATFVCVSLGGLAIGILMGIFTALITKHTEEVRVVEPLAMLGVAYLSYLLAEMIHFSGIISIIGCGIVQAHYASKNISAKSNTTVKYFTKMVSSICDTVIFLFLGMVLVDDQHEWHTGFMLWTAVLCLLIRFASVFLLTYCANKLERTRRINEEEQFIMAYGGLRGAVAFSLVVMLSADIEHKQLFVTTTLGIILFTVIVQGTTIKPLVVLLKIRRQADKTPSSMFTEVNKKLLDHVMAGVEEVTGDHGGNYWKQILFYYNNKYLKRWLQCDCTESNLSRVYTRMMLEDHFAHLYGPAAVIEDKKPLLLHKVSTEDADDMLDVLPPLAEEDEDDDPLKVTDGENALKEEVLIRRYSAKFDFRDIEETRPLKNARAGRSLVRFAIGAAKHLRISIPEKDDSASTGPVPLLKRQTTLNLFAKTANPAEDTSRLLHKALLDNPYNKLHHKYNPNLVDDEDQDMKAHLKARRLRTKRLTLLAMHNGDSTTTPERRPSMEDQVLTTNRLVPLAASYFLERAQKRRSFRKDGNAPPTRQTEATPPTNKTLERQCAMANNRDSNDCTVVTIGIPRGSDVIRSRPNSGGNAGSSETNV